MIVVMPIGGLGKRFKAAGYTFPKPLITIRNKPMLQWAVESLGMPWAHHIFVCSREDVEAYPIREMCAQMTPHQEVVVEEERKGAAPAILLGLAQARTSEDLIIANSDQWLGWDVDQFLRQTWSAHADGSIPVFPSVHPKWSYAKIYGPTQRVTEVAEKRPISPWATCGIYYWKTAQMFIDAAHSMMLDDTKRINGEWYVAPVYNECINQGGHVMAYKEVEMWGMGTPEDLEEFKLKVCR